MSQLRAVILTPPAAGPDRPDIADTFIQADQIATCLRNLGHRALQTSYAPAREANIAKLESLEPDFIFNLVEDLPAGPDRLAEVTHLLDDMGVPYTGAPSAALEALSDKTDMKRKLMAEGLPVPDDIAGTDPDSRYIVKSAVEHASLGLDATSVVTGAAEAIALLEANQNRYGGRWYAEAFVEGREFAVALLETERGVVALPVSEIRFADDHPGPHIVGYAEKWDTTSAAYLTTPRVFPRSADDAPLLAELKRLALAAWPVFGLRGYARVDFRVDATGQPYMLEVNANPCLSANAGFCASAAQIGLSQTHVVENIVSAAFR